MSGNAKLSGSRLYDQSVSLALWPYLCLQVQQSPLGIVPFQQHHSTKIQDGRAKHKRRTAFGVRLPKDDRLPKDRRFKTDCTNLKSFPDTIGNLAALTKLVIGFCDLRALPDSITGNLPRVRMQDGKSAVGTKELSQTLDNAIGHGDIR